MAVALPPPETPILMKMADVPRDAKASVHRFGKYRLNLIGFETIDRLEVRTLIREAPNAEQLIVGLANLVYRSGRMTARIAYAISGQDVYIVLVPRKLREIKARPELRRFFSDSAVDADFDISSFERARLLASAYSTREAWTVQSRFVGAPGNTVDLQLRAEPSVQNDTQKIEVEASNRGSRFAGRNLVGASFATGLPNGYHGMIRGRLAPAQINEASTRGEYLEGEANLNRVGASGVIGLGLRRIEFSVSTDEAELSGWLQEASLEYSDIVMASLTGRGLYGLRLSYSDRQTVLEPGGQSVFQERYSYLEFAPSYSASFGNDRMDLSLSLIGGAASAQKNSFAAADVFLVRPLWKYTWQQSEAYSLALIAVGQWSADVVPESQQWTLGGDGSAAAYAPASLIGDSGFLLRIGQSYAFPLWRGWSRSAELYSEYGHVQRNALPGHSSMQDRVADAGVGLKLSWRRHLDLSVSAAVPVQQPRQPEAERTDFYASITLRY